MGNIRGLFGTLVLVAGIAACGGGGGGSSNLPGGGATPTPSPPTPTPVPSPTPPAGAPTIGPAVAYVARGSGNTFGTAIGPTASQGVIALLSTSQIAVSGSNPRSRAMR